MRHSDNLHTLTYIERKEDDKLIQLSLDYHSERNKLYMNVHDGKNFVNLKLSNDEIETMINALAEALTKEIKGV